jgi:hypothetical protein
MMKVACVVLFLLSAVTALPNGAPICEINSPNPGNKHLTKSRNPTQSTVPGGGYKVTVNGVTLVPRTVDNPDQRNIIQWGQQLDIVISVDSASATPAPYLKGILAIVSGGNQDKRDDLDTKTPNALVPADTTTQAGIGCENFNIASISHTESSQKQSLAGKLFWPVAGQVLYLDVNIVRNNNEADGSQFSYSQYALFTADVPKPRRCGFLRRLLRLCK